MTVHFRDSASNVAELECYSGLTLLYIGRALVDLTLQAFTYVTTLFHIAECEEQTIKSCIETFKDGRPLHGAVPEWP